MMGGEEGGTDGGWERGREGGREGGREEGVINGCTPTTKGVLVTILEKGPIRRCYYIMW